MNITGKNLIGNTESALGTSFFKAFDPSSLTELREKFYDAESEETDLALNKADACFDKFQRLPGAKRADFLDAIASGIEALGEVLVKRAKQETGLPEARITGERGRTCNQLRMFAELVREGSWIEASIDTALPDRTPAPRPDLRKKLVPVGPVIVFGASNFPLAFSVAGGDTASALAAGNPVIVKAHPAHPGTSELVARVILKAAADTGMPEGVFSLVHGNSFQPGKELVSHPLSRSVAFTGSLQGGRALFDLASKREVPIPVFAEMGSINPVIIMEKAMAKRAEEIAVQLSGSVNLGAGQFCTKPGLIFMHENLHSFKLIDLLVSEFKKQVPAIMLNMKISESYDKAVKELEREKQIEFLYTDIVSMRPTTSRPVLAKVSSEFYRQNPTLNEEVFGPFSLIVTYRDQDELRELVSVLEGQLTLTVLAEEDELQGQEKLLQILSGKAGRLIFNGVPTGVEVCPSMQHGGPYPATTDSRFTSVGTSAIKRFARPVSFQSWPPSQLPPELQDDNPMKIWRLLNGSWTLDPVK